MPISAEQQHTILHSLSPLPGIKLVYLFGSRARDQAHENSDWDIALLSDSALDTVQTWQLAQDIAATLGAPVDLVDLASASTVLRMQVVTDGILLSGTEMDADRFAMQTYSMYSHLQEARQDIVQDFINNLTHAGSGTRET